MTTTKISILRKLIREELLKEKTTDHYELEAYGIMGMKSKPWRRKFTTYKKLDDWVTKNDADVQGMRTLKNGEVLKFGEVDPLMPTEEY